MKWREKLEKGEAEFEDIFKSMPYQWSNAEEMKDLFSYLEANPDLVFTGCDNIDDYFYLDDFLVEVDSLAKALQVQVYEKFHQDLEFLLKYRASKAIDANRKEAFLKFLEVLSRELQSTSGNKNTQWIRFLDGLKIHASGWWDMAAHLKADWFDYTTHDSTMALNIKWLAEEKYASEKLIVWAANLHIARNVVSYIESHKYFRNERSNMMGHHLKSFNVDYYSIATISYSGKYLSNADYHIQTIKEKSKKTFENYLAQNQQTAFIDFTDNRNFGNFKMSGVLHYLELNGDWTNVYDGVLFIKEMTPSTFLDR